MMANPCKTCRHPDRAEIDAFLLANFAVHGHQQTIANRYDLHSSAVSRHVLGGHVAGLPGRSGAVVATRWPVELRHGNAGGVLQVLPPSSVQTIVTSPPYFGGLRRYTDGDPAELGWESTPEAFVAALVAVFREARRVLRDDGTLWVVIGDTYWNNPGGGSGTMTTGNRQHVARAGRQQRTATAHPTLKVKDLVLIPHRLALALQADGWWVRADVIWHKPNALPEPVVDRPTLANEHVLLATKRAHYAYHGDAIRELARWERWGAQRSVKRAGKGALPKDLPLAEVRALAAAHGGTKNARSVWSIPTRAYGGPHPAVFPPKLAERCVLAGSVPGDVVLDPFAGSGTTLVVAARLGRRAVGIELDAAKVQESVRRLGRDAPGVRVDVVPDRADVVGAAGADHNA